MKKHILLVTIGLLLYNLSYSQFEIPAGGTREMSFLEILSKWKIESLESIKVSNSLGGAPGNKYIKSINNGTFIQRKDSVLYKFDVTLTQDAPVGEAIKVLLGYTVIMSNSGIKISKSGFKEIEINVTIGTANNELAMEEMEIYPNPTKGILNIINRSNIESKIVVELISYDGKILLKQPLNGLQQINQININHIPQGHYLLRLRNNNQIFSIQKVLKH
jgi:hypothetical protein